MKKINLCLIYILISVSAFAQNPFEKYCDIPTISVKDSKKEFHINKNLIEVGNILFDIKANKIISFIDRPEEEPGTRFLTMDPLAEKYYSISPYVYCANNPLRYVDPTGEELKLYDEDNERYYSYKEGNLYDDKNNIFTPKEGSFIGQLRDVYKMIQSADDLLNNMVNDLVKSENIHYVYKQVDPNAVSNAYGTVYAHEDFTIDLFMKEARGEGTGTKASIKGRKSMQDLASTVAHELQHQHDFDTGNTKDFSPESVSGEKKTEEIRAVNLQNLFNYKTGRAQRNTYGGKAIAPKSLINYWKGQKHPNQK